MYRLTYYFPGVTMILFAIVIIAVPEILAAIVASLVLLAGLSTCYAGHMIRKAKMAYRQNGQLGMEDDGLVWAFLRHPVYGRNRRFY
jgi:hypothetical protein